MRLSDKSGHSNSEIGQSAVQNKSEVKLKNGVFWEVSPCGSHKNRCFGGT
jgi:hypothetical protein